MTLEGQDLDKKEEEPLSFKENVKAVCKLFVNKRMIRLYPEIFWTGATLAINSSMLVNLMADAVKHDGGDDH